MDFLLVRKKSVFNHIKHISFQVLRKMLLENLLKWLFFLYFFFYSVYNETIHIHKSYLFKNTEVVINAIAMLDFDGRNSAHGYL